MTGRPLRLTPPTPSVTAALLALVIAAAVAGGCAPAAPTTGWVMYQTAPAPASPVSPTPVADLDRDTAVRPAIAAPELRLTDQDGRRFDLSSLRGEPVLVFFGYTHCPDVCPTNLADTRAALRLVDGKVGVVFVTVDPARDDAAAMKQYVDAFRSGFIGLTGSEAQVADVAGAWGVSYARVDTGSASGYAMAHTAETFLVDAEGRLRHRIWFGAGPEVIAARINGLATEAITSPSATLAPLSTPTMVTPGASGPATSAEVATVRVRLESSIVRAGRNRVVVTVADQANRDISRPDVVSRFSFREVSHPTGTPVEAIGAFVWVTSGLRGAYVADLTFPHTGQYQATITLDGPGGRLGSGDLVVTVRDRSPTPEIGEAAPSVRTPTAADVGGDLDRISTDPDPDPRFYGHSVDELLATRVPFVFILYSPTFCPTTACGPLLTYMKGVADEFPSMTFVHAEPYAMRDVGSRLEPERDGDRFRKAPWSEAYGIPLEPFVFVVGSDGRIVASFEIIVGSSEIRAAIRTALGE